LQSFHVARVTQHSRCQHPGARISAARTVGAYVFLRSAVSDTQIRGRWRDTAAMNVLITGASSGFGAEIARRFARAGHRIVAAGRRVDRLQALRAELGDSRVLVLPLDVRDGDAVARAIAGLPPELAAVDLLVNNAGLALGLEPAHEASLDDWNQMMDTNVKGL